MTALLDIEDLRVAYGKAQVVHGASLTVAELVVFMPSASHAFALARKPCASSDSLPCG